MTSSPRSGDGPSLGQCVALLKDQEAKLQDGVFPSNYMATQHALEEIREDSDKVKEVHEHLEDVREVQGASRHFEDAETDLLLAEDLQLQKKRGLETVLFVAEIENMYQTLQSDMEERALYLSIRPVVFDSMYRGEDLESQDRLHKDAMYAVRDSWLWLKQVSYCMDVHMGNAAEFHQFHHSIRHLHESLNGFLQWMNSPTIRAGVKTNDPVIVLKHFRLLVNHMLDYQGRLERLTTQSRQIHPLHYRKQLPNWPIRAKALVSYSHKHVSLDKDQEVTVLDNEDPERWLIRTSSGVETEVPAILLAIPPPDPKCFEEIDTLREQVQVHHNTVANRLRSHLIQFLGHSVERTQPKDFQGLSTSQKSDYMKLANDASRELAGSRDPDPEYNQVKSNMATFRKLVSQAKTGQSDLINPCTQNWTSASAVLRQYSELLIYSKHFYHDNDSKRKEENLLLQDVMSPPTYTSHAYFQRVTPVFDIDSATKQVQLTSFKSEIYIHERHRDGSSANRKRKGKSSSSLSNRRPVDEDFIDASSVSRVNALPSSSSSLLQPSPLTETKRIVISGVIDPKTKQKLSLAQALAKGILDKDNGTYNNPMTGESMPIAEAIARGLISVEYLDADTPLTNGHSLENGGGDFVDGGRGHGHDHDPSSALNALETKIYDIHGVVDPKTGETISVKEAMASGLLDLRNGKFRNPITGEELSLLDAIHMGYLLADPSLLEDESNENPLYKSYTSLVLEDAKFQIGSVLDPTTGQEISLKRAIQDGIIDPKQGTYKNPVTGEVMPVEEAMRRGYIKGRPFDPNRDTENENTLTVQQLKVKKQTFKPGEPGLVNGHVLKLEPNDILMDKLREKMDDNMDSLTVVDPESGKAMSLEEAVNAGVINLADGTYKMIDGETISLQEACARGLIDPLTLKSLLKTYEDCSLGELINSGCFDPETGLVTDANSGQVMTLQAALEAGVIDPEATFFFDVPSNRILSLAEAMDTGRLDKGSGKVIRKDKKDRLTVKQAEEYGQILTEINPEEMAEAAESLAMLRECMDTEVKGVKIPHMSGLATVEEAVTLRALQIPKVAYADESSVGVVSLHLAVQMEKVEPSVAMALYSAFDKNSLEQEISRGTLDPKSGYYIDPNTGKKIPVDEARASGVWNPDYVFLVDEEAEKVVSLGEMVNKGKFDPKSGKYLSDTTRKDLSLAEAIGQGLITPNIEAEKYVDTSCPLKDLIDTGKVNPRTTDFVAANGLRMSLRDGLANGFLTMSSKVKLDPETGEVTLVSDEAVVEALVEVKERSDWLSDIERALASQGRPSEKLGHLQRQVEDCQALRQEVSLKEPEVRVVVSQADKLFQDHNQGQTKDKDGKDESTQQFQKLRSSAADLKVRFDSVSTEVDSRTGKLTMMGNNLESLYFHMEECDQWLDTAIEKSQDLQALHSDLDTQYHAYKAFMEEVKEKEEDLQVLVKSTDAFKDDAHELEKYVEAFRKRLDILPSIREEAGTGVLDEELESIEAKFKDISKDCGKNMERLTALVKNKKVFDDLHERLSAAYPSLQGRVNDVVNDDFGMDPDQGVKDLDTLKAIKADLIGQERKLKDLSAAGEKLVSGFAESGMPEDGEEIQAMVDLKREEHRGLLEEITDNEQLLDVALAEHQNVLGRLDGIESALKDAENFLETETAVSLDGESLASQLEELRLLKADIGSSRALLERLTDEADSAAKDKLSDLLSLAESLEHQADDKIQNMEDAQTSLGDIDAHCGEMESWLADSIRSLKPKGGAPKPSNAKVNSIHQAKKEKQPEMDKLRKMCEELLKQDGVKEKYALQETLGAVEAKWNDLTEILVQQVSLEALSEIDGMLKYLDKAENEINTAEPICVDPETLSVQLRDHKTFDEDLKAKRNAVKDIIDKCTLMLRETANSQTDEIKSRLDSINTQADVVCQLSSERLQQLEAALPLATHYGENQTEISAWMEEMEAELSAQGEPGENLEQVKKQHDHLKTTQQIIDDHKLFIDDLNSTGLELMDVCAESDAVDIQNKLLDINKRYEGLKSKARGKAWDLTDAKRKFTQEMTDSLEHLSEDLNGLRMTVSNADPIPASPDKLKNEIDENKAVLEDLDRQKDALAKMEEMAKNPKAHGIEDQGEADDIKQKVAHLAQMAKDVQATSTDRDKTLNSALRLSDKFYDLSTDVMSGLRDLKDSLYSQEPPGVDPEAIKGQQGELAGLKKELEKARELVNNCKGIGADLCEVCGEPGAVEVQKQLEDLVTMTDDINDTIRDRGDELRKAYQHADQFQKLMDVKPGVEQLKSISKWLPAAEHKLASMRPLTSDPELLQQQMEELRAFKLDVHPHIVEMQKLNQEMAALRESSPIAAEVLHQPVKQVTEKWTELLRGMTEREAKLTDTQMKVGEITQAMNDVIASVDSLQPTLDEFNDLKGDPKHLETYMRKLQLMQADVRNREKAARKLNKAVDEILQQEDGDPSESPLQGKREEMNTKIRATQALAKEKENNLQKEMRRVKMFLGELDDQLSSINDFRTELKTNEPFGALPDTSQQQYAEFVKKCQALDNMEKPVESLLASGQEMMQEADDPKTVVQVSDRVKRLKERWADTRDRARKRKEKMEEHLRNVGKFHDTLKTFTDWLNNAEMGMRSFKYPSKLVDVITKQIDEHETMKQDLESQSDKMNDLDRTGTYLKYFGRKQDTVYVKNLLVGIRLRWKKLLRRTDERGRLLQQAYKEDRRFYEAWKGLCDWLDESMQMMSKFMTPSNQPAGMKQDIDELKRFTVQLTAKNPTFYSTTRLGRSLKDRCTKNDPERDVLHGMLEDLKNRWNSVRAVVSRSQNKLDEALLTSGRVSDALHSLLEWLQKAESTLDEEAPVFGDLDTVHMLIEQHRNIQQELSAREATVLTMKAPGNLPPNQSEDLSALWDRVIHLGDVRERKLGEALKLSEEFLDVVTVMREFLPQAEAQLKFRALPEDEMVILQLIEKHEKFQEDLRNHQDTVDNIKGLAEQILMSCHPNAIRFVKYYLTITQTRWDQLLQRAKSRGDRLQEALRNIQGNAALLEELLAWLTDAQALLATKERDPIPEDLKVVETLFKEHLEFHEEVTSKNNDAERLSKLVTSESKMAQQSKGFGSNMKLNEFDGYNPRVIALQNKWRTVWRMSVDRKKQLQDALDTLLELESFKNFDFDLWRQRYLNWIQAKKFRITDFFRRQDKNSDGFLDREEFVSGMLQSKFPTNRTELNAVFDIFDEKQKGVIQYKHFVDALKTDRRNRTKNNTRKAKSDVELIHEEIEKELSSCCCRTPFKAEWLDEGKYRFGEKQKTCLVRFLNHTVMVRVGGGWVTLEEFVEQNDPCKAKGRTNMDLRDTLGLPDGTPNNHHHHHHHATSPGGPHSLRRGSAGGRTSPFPTGVRRRQPPQHQNDTGYASSNSSGTDNPPTSPTGGLLMSPMAVATAANSNNISTAPTPRANRSRNIRHRYSFHGDLSRDYSRMSGTVSPSPVAGSSSSSLQHQQNAGGSNESSLRRSRITSSMVNLSSPASGYPFSTSSNLSRNNDFGSTGNLNRSKRLSTSSSNISGRKTPTPTSSSTNRRSHIFTPRATTPTVAFGSTVRSRPTTPTASSSSTFSSHHRPGSVTPTKGLSSSSTPGSGGPTRQRRLPSTPSSSTSSREFR